MTKKQKKQLYRILTSILIFLPVLWLPLNETGKFIGFLVCYAVIGWDIIWKAVTNILHGQVFDENFLMTVATVGAMCLGDYKEGVAVSFIRWENCFSPMLSANHAVPLQD